MSFWTGLNRLLGYKIRIRRQPIPARGTRVPEVLFRELAFAVRHNCPLDLALTSISQDKTVRFGRWPLRATAVILAFVLLAAMVLIVALNYLGTERELLILTLVLYFVLGLPLLAILAILAAAIGAATRLSAPPGEAWIRGVADRLASRIAQGKTLSEAMFSMPRVFGRHQCTAVTIGERTGHLADSLEALADYSDLSSRMWQIRAAAIYPLTMLFIAGALLAFINIRIMPRYVDVFAQLGADIPAFSQSVLFNPYGGPFHSWIPPVSLMLLFGMLIAMVVLDRLFRRGARPFYWLVLLAIPVCVWMWLPGVEEGTVLVVAAAFVAMIALSVLMQVRKPLLPMAVRLSVARAFGRIVPLWKVQLSRFLYSLGLLLRAKIPVPDALEWAGETARGSLRHEAPRLRDLVEKGQSLSDALKSSPWFRGHVGAVLSLAEWNGSFAEDCIQLAEQLHAEAEGQVARLGALMEYVAIVFLGILLGLFVIACYLPLFYIPQMVR